jgi:ribonucleoside-diphosphate reductase alpha chain
VTGSRQKVVLETQATAKKKSKDEVEETTEPTFDIDHAEEGELKAEQMEIWHDLKKPRPRVLHGTTITIGTPLGKAFITINENGGRQPFEVFINTSKAGSDTAAVSEAIGRLISYILRLASQVAPRERLKEVVRQLQGIGGGRSLGFGPNRVRSFPDGVAQALLEYLDKSEGAENDDNEAAHPGENGRHPASDPTSAAIQTREPQVEQPFLKIGDLCPECGQAAVVNEEGCRKCYACGYSEC